MSAERAPSNLDEQGSDTDSLEPYVERLLTALRVLESSQLNEAKALGEGRVDELRAAVEHKRAALRDVEALAHEPPLRALLEPRGASPEHASELGPAAERLRSWPHLLRQIERCRDLNQAAGGAIAAAQRSVDYALRLLGRTPETATYDAGGNVGSDGARRDLAVC